MDEQISHNSALQRAASALEGLSVGDAFGEQFFFRSNLRQRLTSGQVAPGEWFFTDDTNMALSIYAILRQCQQIDQDKLAQSFGLHFDAERGYGHGARNLLRAIVHGDHWRTAAKAMFGGQGSFGNGSAMRIAPLGAYFADDLPRCAEQARLSAEVTHAHDEGIVGGIAAALAAAVASSLRGSETPSRADFIDRVLPYVPPSEVRSRLTRARDMQAGEPVHRAVHILGNGSQISAQDTVAFCIWCAGEQLANYEQALWMTASAAGDVDTNCAIVGGIVSAYTGIEGIPDAWRLAREPLPEWAFQEEI